MIVIYSTHAALIEMRKYKSLDRSGETHPAYTFKYPVADITRILSK